MTTAALKEEDFRRRIGELERLVQRQMDMLERYDRTLSRLPQAASEASGQGARVPGAQEYGRLIELLDRAVSRAEQLEGDKRQLQSHLEKTLQLLDDALRNQERMQEKASAPSAIPQVALPGAASRSENEAVAVTLARYDSMLERSLAALDAAYRANSDRERQIEDRNRQIRERDKLLERTLSALQNAVDDEAARTREPAMRRRLASLFS